MTIIAILISSFGHKYGTPGADCVLNARKVKNPGQEFRNTTGLNKKVRSHVMQDPKADCMVQEGVRIIQEQVDLMDGEKTINTAGNDHQRETLAEFCNDNALEPTTETGSTAALSNNDLGKDNDPPMCHFHLAIGCDRGKHRSVSIAIEIGRALQEQQGSSLNINVTVFHRDIHK